MKTRTYLEKDDPRFWNKLLYEMPDRGLGAEAQEERAISSFIPRARYERNLVNEDSDEEIELKDDDGSENEELVNHNKGLDQPTETENDDVTINPPEHHELVTVDVHANNTDTCSLPTDDETVDALEAQNEKLDACPTTGLHSDMSEMQGQDDKSLDQNDTTKAPQNTSESLSFINEAFAEE